MEKGLLIVLTGKTASGKDTIKSQLLLRYPSLKRVITTTSRSPRAGEKDGVDYYFIPENEFRKKAQNGKFVEYVEYGGNLYGTTKSELENSINGDALWRIDPSRAGEVRDFIKRAFPPQVAEKLIKRALVIYITVSDEVVLQRLKIRNLSSQEIEKRMTDDKKIWDQYKDNYDYVLENMPGRLDETINKISQLIENHSSTPSR